MPLKTPWVGGACNKFALLLQVIMNVLLLIYIYINKRDSGIAALSLSAEGDAFGDAIMIVSPLAVFRYRVKVTLSPKIFCIVVLKRYVSALPDDLLFELF